MKKVLLILICLQLLLSLAATLACNATHLNFISKYSLGKQDELNRTFTKIQEKLPTLNNITYSAPSGADYKIFGIQLKYYYRDSGQKATFRGEDVIIIDGGDL
jgi:hypothetical protein